MTTLQAALTDYTGAVNVRDFGALGDGSTDDLAAFNAAIASFASFDSGDSGNGGQIAVPPGNYILSGTLNVNRNVQIVGANSGYPFGLGISKLTFTAAGDGIVCGWYQGIYQGSEAKYGAGTLIKNLMITSTATTGTGNGIVINTKAFVDGCYVTGFKGQGCYVYGDAPTNGNANNFGISYSRFYNNGKCGIKTYGADANAGVIIGVDCSLNGEYGFLDASFLGNTYLGCHTSANVLGAYKSTNENSRNIFLGCYSESGQSDNEMSQYAAVIGGLHASTVTGSGPRILERAANIAFEGGLTPGYGDACYTFNKDGDDGLFTWDQISANQWGYGYQFLGDNAYKPMFLTKTATGLKITFQNGFELGSKVVMSGTAAPTTGTWAWGDRVVKSDPVAGGIEGYVCVTAGTPGVWKTYGAISA